MAVGEDVGGGEVKKDFSWVPVALSGAVVTFIVVGGSLGVGWSLDHRQMESVAADALSENDSLTEELSESEDQAHRLNQKVSSLKAELDSVRGEAEFLAAYNGCVWYWAGWYGNSLGFEPGVAKPLAESDCDAEFAADPVKFGTYFLYELGASA